MEGEQLMRLNSQASSTRDPADSWEALRQLCAKIDRGPDLYGAAMAHPRHAREEAALKLLSNHHNVLRDICNASPTHNIDGVALTQTELKRLPPDDKFFVDQFLREVVLRLLGGRVRCYGLHEWLSPSKPQRATAWVQAAQYLEGRIHSTPEQKPGRKPDLGPEAAAAMTAVMAEISQVVGTWASLKQAAATKKQPGEAFGSAAEHAWDARLEAARKLIGNHAN
eukprot:1038948-Prymnesium_polylepis.1